jgi:3'(2'), 5'-bisphosphate nucleotidase
MNSITEIKLPNLLDLAKDAAVCAGQEIMKIYTEEDFGIEHKKDESPLTKADKAAHNIIVKKLESSQLPILSEEGTEISFDERSKWDYFWMVDPLDGTKEFIKRNGEFTVNIALIKNGSPVMGVVYTPVTSELFFALEGSGAYKMVEGFTHSLQKSANETLEGLRVVASRSHLNEETKSFMNRLINPEIVSMGSSLKFIVLSEGNAEVYPRFAPTMEWDSAAAHVICNEVGLEVLNVKTKKALEYNKEDLLNPYFIVASPRVLKQLDLV